MFKVRLTAKARRQLKNLSKQGRLSVREIIEDIKDDSLIGKSLGRELSRKYSYRIGVYRVIYTVNLEDKLVDILEADHRGKIYN